MSNSQDGSKKPMDAIVCPYCFNDFSHADVHFRVRSLAEIGFSNQGTDAMTGDKAFLRFWEQFKVKKDVNGGSDENEDYITEKKKRDGLAPQDIPVANPKDSKNIYLKMENGKPVCTEDGSGMLWQVLDKNGTPTRERVCPFCHNPIPEGYGRFPTFFISVIGVTSSGKTVYLSQLLQTMNQMLPELTGLPMIDSADGRVRDFIANNPIMKGKKLPTTTKPHLFNIPLIFDIGGNENGKTIVLYDIAGENCVETDKMNHFGPYVRHSDAIILLISPKQLGLTDRTSGTGTMGDPGDREAIKPTSVLDTIHRTIVSRGKGKSRIPIAVCVSKGDTIWDDFKRIAKEKKVDIYADREITGKRPLFNAEEYNRLERILAEMIRGASPSVSNLLKVDYERYNYFLFSSLGRCSVAKGERDRSDTLQSDPTPKRLMEPFLWTLKQLGVLDANSAIRLPEARSDDSIPYLKPGMPFGYRVSKMLGWWYAGNEYRELTEEEKEQLWYEEN